MKTKLLLFLLLIQVVFANPGAIISCGHADACL